MDFERLPIPIRARITIVEDKDPTSPYRYHWMWDLGRCPSKAYGEYAYDGKRRPAHRFMYELSTGEPLPPELVPDHLCCIPRCVNPEHLEAVTKAENSRRAWAAWPERRRQVYVHKAKCAKGHDYDEENTSWTPKGTQVCKQCRRDQQAARYADKTKREDMLRRRREANALQKLPFIGPRIPPEACVRGHRRIPGLGAWQLDKVWGWKCFICHRIWYRGHYGYGDDLRFPTPKNYERAVAAAYEFFAAGQEPVFTRTARGAALPPDLPAAMAAARLLWEQEQALPPPTPGTNGGKFRQTRATFQIPTPELTPTI